MIRALILNVWLFNFFLCGLGSMPAEKCVDTGRKICTFDYASRRVYLIKGIAIRCVYFEPRWLILDNNGLINVMDSNCIYFFFAD